MTDSDTGLAVPNSRVRLKRWGELVGVGNNGDIVWKSDTVETGPDGEFAIDHAPDGTRYLYVQHADYAPFRTDIFSVAEGETRGVAVTMNVGTNVRISVRRKVDGGPCPHAQVMLDQVPDFIARTETDAHGVAHLAHCAPGGYFIGAWAQDGAENGKWFEIAEGAPDCTVELQIRP